MKKIRTIQIGGVSVRSDMCLYEQFDCDDEHAGAIVLLSIYGATQQVQAIFASLAGNKDVCVKDSLQRLRRDESPIMVRSRTLKRGKRHMLIWDVEKIRLYPIWLKNEEKEQAMENFLAGRKVPYDVKCLETFEQKLLEEDILLPLKGWGGLQGYVLRDYANISLDDRLCHLMLESLGERAECASFGSNTFMERTSEKTREFDCVL